MSTCETDAVDVGQKVEELQRALEQSQAFLANLELQHAQRGTGQSLGCIAAAAAAAELGGEGARNEEAPEPTQDSKKGIRSFRSLKSKLTQWFSSRRMVRVPSIPTEAASRRLSFSRVNIEFPSETVPATPDSALCDDMLPTTNTRQRALSVSVVRPISLGRGVSFTVASKSVNGGSSGLCSPAVVSPVGRRPQTLYDVVPVAEVLVPRRASTSTDSPFQNARGLMSAMGDLQQAQQPQRHLLVATTSNTSSDFHAPLSALRASSLRKRASIDIVPVQPAEQLTSFGGTAGVYGGARAWGARERVAKFPLPLVQVSSKLQFEFSTVGESQQRADAASAAAVRAKSLPSGAHHALGVAGGWYGIANSCSCEDASLYDAVFSTSSVADTVIPGALPEGDTEPESVAVRSGVSAGSSRLLSQAQLTQPQLQVHLHPQQQLLLSPWSLTSPAEVTGRTGKGARRSSLERLQVKPLAGIPEPVVGSAPGTRRTDHIRSGVRRQTWINEVFVPVSGDRY